MEEGDATAAEAVSRRIEEDLLGPARYSGDEVAVVAGMDIEEAERLWVELGFPLAGREARRFTNADAEVLVNLRHLRASGLVATEDIAAMARVLGQALARVAAAQAQLTLSMAGMAPGTEAASAPDIETLPATVELSVAVNERFVSYAWRRHLASAFRQLLDPRPTDVIGFADLVGYTRLSSSLDAEALGALLIRFQEATGRHVAANGGTVLKLIGDAVMFSAPHAAGAARAALALRDELAADEEAPSVRIGLAMGPVVHHEGDVYGDTVNRASRLAELAHRDTIVADDDVADAASAEPDVTVRPMRPRRLKGLGLVRTWSVRHTPPGTS